MFKLIATLGIVFAGVQASAAFTSQQPIGFTQYGNPAMVWGLPANGLHLMDRVDQTANITKEQFMQIIDEVGKIWVPIAKAKGVELSFNKNWDDGTVNASAMQSGNRWIVNMYGGLARRPEVTPDGFALVVCHELGHHFGGYTFGGNSAWNSNEGQSDYWATQACARYAWGMQQNINRSWARIEGVPASVEQKCGQVWGSNENARGWCIRAAAAGFSLANLLGNLGRSAPVDFDKPDQTVVTRTNNAHPQAQCRLDTYFAGALCPKNFDLNVIPGKNHRSGQISAAAEVETMKSSCFSQENFQLGTRPLCWFKSAQ